MALRVAANEKLSVESNEKLSRYEEKLSMKQLFLKHGIPFAKVRLLLAFLGYFWPFNFAKKTMMHSKCIMFPPILEISAIKKKEAGGVRSNFNYKVYFSRFMTFVDNARGRYMHVLPKGFQKNFTVEAKILRKKVAAQCSFFLFAGDLWSSSFLSRARKMVQAGVSLTH